MAQCLADQPQRVHDLIDEGRVQGGEGGGWGPLPFRAEGVVHINRDAHSNVIWIDKAEQWLGSRPGRPGYKG